MADLITFCQKKSAIGYNEDIKSILKGLGITKMNKKVTRTKTKEIEGMIKKVQHLVQICEG